MYLDIQHMFNTLQYDGCCVLYHWVAILWACVCVCVEWAGVITQWVWFRDGTFALNLMRSMRASYAALLRFPVPPSALCEQANSLVAMCSNEVERQNVAGSSSSLVSSHAWSYAASAREEKA